MMSAGFSLTVRFASPFRHITFFADYATGQTIAQAIYLSGNITAPALCSGIAMCKRCRVRILEPQDFPILPEDRQAFSKEELSAGWRLGCRHYPLANMTVELPPDAVSGEPADASVVAECRGFEKKLFLAVDFGSTTVAWKAWPEAFAMGNAPETASGKMINPQMGSGSDIVSRLAATMMPGGREALARVSALALRTIIGKVEKELGGTVSSLCIAANPAVSAFTLGIDSSGLAASPYKLPLPGNSWELLPELPPVWIPPQLSPFVGGDASAGYADIALREATEVKFPFLLADFGTNGEFILAVSPDEAVTASVALGPALEGIGLSCGTEARPGAVSGFFLSRDGLGFRVLDDSLNAQEASGRQLADFSPAGITGTGYISLVNLLLASGAMHRDGFFALEKSPLLSRSIKVEQALTGAVLNLGGGLSFSAKDVEELLKVKAAASLGFERLLEFSGLSFREVERIYLSGALGWYADKDALENLGFFPPGASEKIFASGNTSLRGAELLLSDERVRDRLAHWAANAHSLDLASDVDFVEKFPDRMVFSWK